MQISDLGLSVRATNCLSRAGIKTAEELAQKSDLELLGIRSFGIGCLHEVREALARMEGTMQEQRGLPVAGKLPEQKMELYKKTVTRLGRGGIKDPTAQIIALAEEIERYRDKIMNLEAALYGLPANSEKQDPLLTAALKQVVEKYEKAKGMDYVRNNLAWALYQVWKAVDSLEG